MKKILLIFGTRPEAIKMAAFVPAFKKQADFFQLEICLTGQHQEMIQPILGFFDIYADHNLHIMEKAQDLFSVTSRCLTSLKTVLDTSRPDCVLVQGDTSSTFTGALAAFYQKIPVGHIEAGLRTGNPYSPWPEEINRRMVTQLATWHFAPTKVNQDNLLKEGIDPQTIITTGNTVIDSLLIVKKKITNNLPLISTLEQEINNAGYPKISDKEQKIILVTGHRRENFGQGFANICAALKGLAQKYPHYQIVYPVHLNPNVQKPVFETLGAANNIYLTKPLNYAAFVYLMDRSLLVLTDSGGIQEEAPALGKPVVVMRDTTERPEAILAGTAQLVGTEKDGIINAVSLLIDDKSAYNKAAMAFNPYGNGQAAEIIVDFLRSKL